MQRILLVQMFFRIPGKSFRRFWDILSRLKFERVLGNIPAEFCKKPIAENKTMKKKKKLLSNSFEENIFHTSTFDKPFRKAIFWNTDDFGDVY